MNAGRDLLLFIFFLVALGVAWFMTGGPSHPLAQAGWFMNPLAPIGNGSDYGTSTVDYTSPVVIAPTSTGAAQENPANTLWDYFFSYRAGAGATARPGNSPYAQYVTLSAANARASNPEDEYLTLQTSSNLQNTITITGWTLESAQSGLTVPIGNAAQIPFLGQQNSAFPVSLGPDSTAYLVTGVSPNGASFRLNKCTGYFNQFQRFNPALPQECPTPNDEMLRHPEAAAGNTLCQDYVNTLPQCQLVVTAIPGNVGGTCQSFVMDTLSYNGCITEHQRDPDFYRNEWRIYLGRSQELWNNRHDDIRLLDENGKLVSEVTY